MCSVGNMHSDYRHAKHDEMERRIRQGLTDTAIARELKVDRRAVARVRSILGLPPMTNSTTKGDKLDRYSSEPDASGHAVWHGRVGPSGNPLIRHRGVEVPASHVAFERRTGRAPVGICRADCDVPHCVGPSHVLDDLERRDLRGKLRAMHGLRPVSWDECPHGHDWNEHGRFDTKLSPYCKRCGSDRARRNHAARKETRNES